MPRTPSAVLIGDARPHWQPATVHGCPFGRLVCAICPSDPPAWAIAALHPSEQEYLRSIPSPQRQREWVGGRLCLAAALGCDRRDPLLVTPSGAPLVLSGRSGSVSHKGPVVVALAAVTASAIGVDVERVDRDDDQLHWRVLTAAERERLPDDDEARRRMSVMHFSIKEAVYKTLDPADQADLDFEDIEVVLEGSAPRIWTSVDVRLVGRTSRVKAAIVFDGDWLIAAAMREPAI